MKKTIIRAASIVAAVAALSLGASSTASAIPPAGHWTLTGKTPISTGYMYTYRNAAGQYYVSAEFHGYSFFTINVR